MKNSNSNAKKNCGAAYIVSASVSFALIIAGIFIYWYIPVSDIANSIEHSAKDALYLLAISPVCTLIAAILYLVGGLTDKALVRNSVVQRVIFIVSEIILFFITAVSSAMFFSQLSLGFVAPVDGTVWNTLGIINIVVGVLYTAANGYIIITARK